MEPRAEQVIAAPTWGCVVGRERAPVRKRRVVLGTRGSIAQDVAGAVLVLGGSAALWAAFLVAVW